MISDIDTSNRTLINQSQDTQLIYLCIAKHTNHFTKIYIYNVIVNEKEREEEDRDS